MALTLLPNNGLNRTAKMLPLLRSVSASLLTISVLGCSLPGAFAQQSVNVGNTVSSTKNAPTKKHRRTTSRSSRAPLASRGDYNRAQDAGLPALTPKTITGRVAVVSIDQAIMRREYTTDSPRSFQGAYGEQIWLWFMKRADFTAS